MNRLARVGDFTPHNVRLRSAVKEGEKRRAIPTEDSVNRGAKSVDRMGFESRKKEGCCLALNRSQLALQEKLPLREHSVVGLATPW